MFGKMKIKSQVILVISLILSVVIVLQLFLYFVLQSKNAESISTIFDSIVDNTEAQIKNLNYDISELAFLLSVHSIIQSSLYEYSPAEIIKNMKKIKEVISDYHARNQTLRCVAVIKEHELFMSSESVDLYNEVTALIETYANSADAQKLFTPSFQSGGYTYFAYVMAVFPTDVTYYSAQHTGNYIICIYEIDTINYSPYSFIDNNTINLLITDENNHVLLSANPDEHGKLLDAAYTEKNYLSKTIKLQDPAWSMTVFMPMKSASGLPNISNSFALLMGLFNIIMLILMVRLLNGTLVKRTMILKEAIKWIPAEGGDYCVTYKYQDEFSEIVAVINQILRKISSLNQEKMSAMDKLFKARLLQNETQIYYLYGQMSPHFLYNSMSCIQGMAFQYNATEIVQITSSLSNVFRYFSSNLNLATIKQDIDFAVEYFNIINIRRPSPIAIHCEIDKELYNVRCLKMIYQPILENILKHAFGPEDEGSVTISSIADEKRAIIEISDNGKGIPADVLQSLHTEMSANSIQTIRNSVHVGLTNVHMRLKLYYDEGCGLKIKSSSGKGTQIQIIFSKEAKEKDLYPHSLPFTQWEFE